jgi:hypothetical protein
MTWLTLGSTAKVSRKAGCQPLHNFTDDGHQEADRGLSASIGRAPSFQSKKPLSDINLGVVRGRPEAAARHDEASAGLRGAAQDVKNRHSGQGYFRFWGTFRRCRDVQLEPVMRIDADIRQRDRWFTALPGPRRPPQRLRRLAEGADEGAAHALGIAEARDLGDPLDRLG